MTLSMVELGQVASFTSNLVIADLGFRFHLDGLCFHEIPLSERFTLRSYFFVILDSSAHCPKQEWHSNATIPLFVITSCAVIVPHRVQ
jgi:hypothetical protein